MNEKYVEECKNFRWLQENGDKIVGIEQEPELIYDEITGEDIYCPRLDTLIELLGDGFIELNFTMSADGKKIWHVKTPKGDSFGETPELACLFALKKIKGEE